MTGIFDNAKTVTINNQTVKSIKMDNGVIYEAISSLTINFVIDPLLPQDTSIGFIIGEEAFVIPRRKNSPLVIEDVSQFIHDYCTVESVPSRDSLEFMVAGDNRFREVYPFEDILAYAVNSEVTINVAYNVYDEPL